MRNIVLIVIMLLTSLLSFSQVNSSSQLKYENCISATYTFTNGYGDQNKITLHPSMQYEYHGYCYNNKNKENLGKFSMHGQWGLVDSTLINILTGKIGPETSKDAEYYCFHIQNSGVKASVNILKGELTYRGNVYKRVGGPCTLSSEQSLAKSNSINNITNNNYSNPNAEIKSATIDLMNQWTQSSDDVRVKKIAENLNNVQESINMFQKIDPDNTEGFDQIENFAMGIGIIAGMFQREVEEDPKKQYWINGKLLELTDAEVADRGIKILRSPYSVLEVMKIKEQIEEKISLNVFFEKRIELFRQLIADVSNVNEDEIRLLKSKIYLAHIQGNERKRELAWINLLNSFTSEKTVRIFTKLEKLNNRILKLIIIEREVLKEVLLDGYFSINKSSWRKEEIINFHAQGKGDLSNKFIFSESPEIFIQTRNRFFPSSFWDDQGQDLLKLTKYISPSTNQTSLTQVDLLPINIYNGSLDSYNNKAFNCFINEAIKLKSPVSLNKFKYSSSLWDHAAMSANINLLKEEHFQPSVYFLFLKLKPKPSKYLSEVMLGSEYEVSKKEYLSSLKIDINTVRTALANYHKRINKLSNKPIPELKYVKVRQASNLDYKYVLNMDAFFWSEIANYDLNSYKLTKNSLEQINILISYFETKIDNNTTIGDNLVKWNVYKGWRGAIMMKPFMRLYLFRYYIEKQSGITTHTESDESLIRENLYYVLEDFIRTEGNIEIAKNVLDDIGIE